MQRIEIKRGEHNVSARWGKGLGLVYGSFMVVLTGVLVIFVNQDQEGVVPASSGTLGTPLRTIAARSATKTSALRITPEDWVMRR